LKLRQLTKNESSRLTLSWWINHLIHHLKNQDLMRSHQGMMNQSSKTMWQASFFLEKCCNRNFAMSCIIIRLISPSEYLLLGHNTGEILNVFNVSFTIPFNTFVANHSNFYWCLFLINCYKLSQRLITTTVFFSTLSQFRSGSPCTILV